MAKSDKPRTHYTVVLHPKRGYSACGYGHPGRRWRGTKQFYNLAAALLWADKVCNTLYKRKRPWESFQVLQYKNYETETLIFAYLEHQTIIIPSLTHSAAAV